MSEEKRPVDQFRDAGVQASIWENGSGKNAFRIATFQLRYRDKDENWQTSTSYGTNDLLHLEKAVAEARSRIMTWQRSKGSTNDNG